MKAYRKHVVIADPSRLVLEDLPFHPGERVEIVVLSDDHPDGLADEMRALFKRTQALPHVQELTEADIAKEIEEYRAGR
jgi:hypothetical protein